MSNIETKAKILEALRNRGEWMKQVNDVEYRTRCPYCGDSLRENTGHLYIRISLNDNYPIVYNCFKCGVSGILQEEQLSKLGIEDIGLKSKLIQLNKTSAKVEKKDFYSENKTKFFNFKQPPIIIGEKTNYIKNRLNIDFTPEDYRRMKVITSLKSFLNLNEIDRTPFPPQMVKNLEDHYVGFLTYGNSHILFRDITETEEYPWIKYPIIKESVQNRVIYTLATEIDIFSDDDIFVNIGEGVFDLISAEYNLGFKGKNTLSIAVSGKYYEKILLFLLELGIVGSNVNIRIFSDNDLAFNKKAKNPTTMRYFRKALERYKYLFGKINVYYNVISKDIGVPKERIHLIDYQI